MTASLEVCAIRGSVARCLLSPVQGSEVGDWAIEAEDTLVLLAVGAQLNAVLLGYHQRDFQDVDRVQAQTLAVQRLVRLDVGGRDLQVQGLHDEAGDLAHEYGSAHRGAGLAQGRHFVGHGSHYTRRRAMRSGRRTREPGSSRKYMDVSNTLSRQ